MESLQGGALQSLAPKAELKTMPVSQLVQLQKQFRQDLSHIEAVSVVHKGTYNKKIERVLFFCSVCLKDWLSSVWHAKSFHAV